MKKLLTILSLLFTLFVSAQTFTFTQLTTDYPRPGGGFERWNRQNDPYGTMHIPVNGTPQESMDYYERMGWNDFFNNPTSASDSTFNWTKFDQRAGLAQARGQGFSFGIMSQCNNCDPGNNNLVTYDNGQNSYPKFLHDLMQSESTKDWLCSNGDQVQWIANYNSPHYLRWVKKTCDAIRAHINSTSISGVPLTSIVKLYDVRFYGNYGEFHWEGVRNQNQDVTATFPAGTFPTAASLDSIVSKQLQAFEGFLITIPFNALDANWLDNTRTPQAFSQWLIEHKDSIGFRWDHLSDDQGYDHSYWEQNNRVGGSAGTGRILNRWRTSPIRGEPPGYGGQPTNLSFLNTQVQNLHLNSFGNGNYGNPQFGGYDNNSTTAANNARLAAKTAGHRLTLTGGNVNTTGGIQINLNWQNLGVSPTYENWTVKYLVKNGAGTTVATLTSAFNPKRFLPTGSPVPKTDNFASPAVPVGTYGLYVIVTDPLNYRAPYPLAITGRQSDGSYFLANISLGAGPTNQSPVADAGANQSITISTATLNGTGSTDPDGTISSYLWTQLPGGPNTAGITSPSSATTGLTGLVGGTYVFNLLVTDNNGATSGDNVTITVNLNTPPVANAGANQTISLPTTTVSLSGSASTDNLGIVTYTWTNVLANGTYTIVSPLSVNTNITSLQAGLYTFRLTVADASGLSSSDDVNVTVVNGNQPPVANAGANITNTLPTNFTILGGGNSTDDVGIVSYLWTQVGGPNTATLVTPTNVNTSLTGLIQGFYTFRLTVTDGGGLSSSDDVQVTVNPPTNTAPIANAGVNQLIVLPTNTVNVSGSASTDNVGIVSYSWAWQSGPATFTIATPNTVNTAINNLVAGVYVFRLTVADGSGLTSFDDVIITVNPAANTPPVANAGGNQAITLPTSTTSLSASGSSDDVGITAYLWTKISGPTGGTIGSPTSSTTGITALQAGIYVYRLRVTDGSGLFDEDDVTITVNPADNNAPVADAGANQTITLPNNTVTQVGSGTDDNAVTGYLWTQVSGPSVATISAATSATTNFNNLIAGTYFFQLQVSDANGLTDVDEVVITVLPAVVVPPVIGTRSHFRTNRKFLPRAF